MISSSSTPCVCLCMALCLFFFPVIAQSAPASVWQQSMAMGAAGHDETAIAHLSGALAVMPDSMHDLWRERMQLAVILLDMKQQQQVDAPGLHQDTVRGWTETALIRRYQQQHPQPEAGSIVMPAMLATILPGAGHAWQGRWRDAGVAAMLVIPMLLLTLWAMRRHMGPVTLFFALITIWLWSGSVFSAISLAERASAEIYMLWWQGLWQAAALPGRPW